VRCSPATGAPGIHWQPKRALVSDTPIRRLQRNQDRLRRWLDILPPPLAGEQARRTKASTDSASSGAGLRVAQRTAPSGNQI
jgi:hypothetical protein